MWWKEASQAWLLWLLFSISVAPKKNIYIYIYQQGPITPDNLLYTLLFLPKNALLAVAGNWENTFFILNIAIQVPGKIFFGKLTIFHDRVPRPHDEFMLCMYWERVSFPPVAICHVSFNMVDKQCIWAWQLNRPQNRTFLETSDSS